MEGAEVEVLALLQLNGKVEFLNRIDDIIMFTPLNKAEILEIVKLQLRNVSNILGKQHIVLNATEEADNKRIQPTVWSKTCETH